MATVSIGLSDGMMHVIEAATTTTSVELQVRDGRHLLVLHEIRNGSSGAYCSLKLCTKTRSEAALSAVAIKATGDSGLVRSSNVTTMNTAAPHGLIVGDGFVVSGATPDGATTFDGEFTVKTVTDADTITYDDTAADDTGGGGTVYRITEIAAPTTGGNNLNIQTSVTPNDYVCVFGDVGSPGSVLRLTCNVNSTNGGTNDVWVKMLEG